MNSQIPRISRYIKKTMLSARPGDVGILSGFAVIVFSGLVSLWNWRSSEAIQSLLFASKETVFEKWEFWRVITGQLIHADFGHLASNSLMLFIFTLMISGYFGVKNYLFTTLVVGFISNAITLLTYESNIRLVGISGIVYLLAGYWLVLFFLIARNYSLLSRSFRVIAFTLVVLTPSTFQPQTSYRAHAIGFVCGVVWGGIYFLMRKRKFRSHEILDEVRYLQDQIDNDEFTVQLQR